MIEFSFFVLKIKYYMCILKFMEFWFYFVSFVFLSMNKKLCLSAYAHFLYPLPTIVFRHVVMGTVGHGEEEWQWSLMTTMQKKKEKERGKLCNKKETNRQAMNHVQHNFAIDYCLFLFLLGMFLLYCKTR